MTQEQAKPPRDRRRALRVALVLSLMVNVLVIGILAGGAMRMRQFHPGPPDVDFRSLWRALPDEARDALRAQYREGGLPGMRGPRPDRAEHLARAREFNARVLEMLRAPQFDAEAFARLLGEERARVAARLDAAQRAFADSVANLDPAQRLQMAERLESLWRDRLPPHRDPR